MEQLVIKKTRNVAPRVPPRKEDKMHRNGVWKRRDVQFGNKYTVKMETKQRTVKTTRKRRRKRLNAVTRNMHKV
jgi:hypothetical protein